MFIWEAVELSIAYVDLFQHFKVPELSGNLIHIRSSSMEYGAVKNKVFFLENYM